MSRRFSLLALATSLFVGWAAGRAVAGDEIDPLEALDLSFPVAATKAEPYVVSLDVEREDRPERPLTQREKMQLGISGLRMFDARYFQRPPGPCSAVVIKNEGGKAYFATSTWNVRDSKKVSVVLPNGEKRELASLGRDENLDVILLEGKDCTGLPAAPVAPKTRVGQYAVLVGKGGDRGTPIVTVGSVSAIGRHKGDSIQVSCRMNYANVGGAVVDLEGRLLGIATRLTDRAPMGLNSGVGFAAPVERLLKHMDQLASGKVVPKRKNPFLGVKGDLKPLPEGKLGVRIEEVVADGAAQKAGIKNGDIVKIFNGVELKDFGQLRDEIEKLEVGDKVIVTVEREDWGEKDFTIELGARPPESEE